MRTTVIKVAFLAVLIIASAALVAVPARADGGNPFQPTDNRVNPMTGDRLAVYCNADRIDVLGIDNSANGFSLASFPIAQFNGGAVTSRSTQNGNVTLMLDPAFMSTLLSGGTTIQGTTNNTNQGTLNNQGTANNTNQSTSNTQAFPANGMQIFAGNPTNFVVTWTGGQFGADGTSQAFVKHFSCGYNFMMTQSGFNQANGRTTGQTNTTNNGTRSTSTSGTGSNGASSNSGAAATPVATANP